MKYLCLIYLNEAAMNELPKNEWDALVRDCMSCDVDLQTSGHLLRCDKLQPVYTATTLRVRNGKLSTTDGPFAETKEQLGGYCLIDARDFDEAIEIAGNLPPARYGSVEVRPVRELPSRI